jgi:DNA-binding NtrC family response regulator
VGQDHQEDSKPRVLVVDDEAAEREGLVGGPKSSSPTWFCRESTDVFNREDNRQVAGLDPAAAQALMEHAWPGNVRELRNVMQRAVAIAGHGLIDRAHLSLRPASLLTSFEELESQLIDCALAEASGDRRRAAARMGVSLATLDKKMGVSVTRSTSCPAPPP